VKEALQAKEIKCVIATTVWREGINIPSLGCIINACGGKSEIVTLQAIGRGLRTSEGKDRILVVDFLDPYKYLAQHAIMRIQTYVETGCM
jgi:superfamily II DNA or RNA helicase